VAIDEEGKAMTGIEKSKLKTIREAIGRRHGGFEQASDEQVLRVWRSLPADAKKAYLATNRETTGREPAKQEKKDHADST